MTPSRTAEALRLREGTVFAEDGPFPVARVRVHRAVSWIGRAEGAADADARFLFLWIAFNALYAEDHDPSGWGSERKDQQRFFEAMDSCARVSGVHDAIWTRYYDAILRLIRNHYAYWAFWKHRNAVPGFADWQARWERENARIKTTLFAHDTRSLLKILFDRLYVVRNQLLHGGATWGGRLNRSQVEDGAAILGTLVPIFVELIMDHPDRDWGRPHYAPGPRVEDVLARQVP